MPDTRAAKRLKVEHRLEYGEEKSDESRLAPHEKQLHYLNSLSSTEFETQHIPRPKLQFYSAKQPNYAYMLDFRKARQLDRRDFERCFALVEMTSKPDYAPSSRGWHPKSKRAEMREHNMRYVIVRRERQVSSKTTLDADVKSSEGSISNASSTVVDNATTPADENDNLNDFGFMSFQLDDDWIASSTERIPILYIYEIHLDKELRGLGLGLHLMDLARDVALATQMSKVELSVFTSNARALQFYRALGYEVDETSPETVKKGKEIIETDWLVLSLDLRTLNGKDIPSGKGCKKSPV